MSNEPQADGSTPTGELEGKVWLPKGWHEVNVAVALSGGADSMALLAVCRKLKQRLGGAGRLLAFHVNHQLRGEESTEDARWCQQQCDAMSVALQVMTCDTEQHSRETGEGIESAARDLRYRLLIDASEQAGVRYLATAHTYDDRVETILFRILRGTGLRGLEGIPRTRALNPSISLIRPLFDCSRAMVLRYLSDLGQNYRQDSSNTDRQFTRNRLRLDLLPRLRDEYNQDVDAAIVRLATQASDAQQTLEHLADQLIEAAELSSTSGKLVLDRRKLTSATQPVVREALRMAWREAHLPQQAMTYEWWSRLAQFACVTETDGVLNLPGSVRASTTTSQLVLQW